MVGAPPCTLKGGGFDYWSEHMARSQCGFDPWLGHTWEATNPCFSLTSMPLSPFLRLEIHICIHTHWVKFS